MGNNRDWSRGRVGRIGCCDRPARVRITAGRHEGRVVLVSEGEVPSKGTALGCQHGGGHGGGRRQCKGVACSSYLNVEWRALRPVMADGPERGRTIFPRHVVLLTEIMPRRPISSETTLG